jgi:hypothetical protein
MTRTSPGWDRLFSRLPNWSQSSSPGAVDAPRRILIATWLRPLVDNGSSARQTSPSPPPPSSSMSVYVSGARSGPTQKAVMTESFHSGAWAVAVPFGGWTVSRAPSCREDRVR